MDSERQPNTAIKKSSVATKRAYARFFGTLVSEKSAKHLNEPHFFAISKARVLDENAQNGLKHHLPSVSGRIFK